MPTVVCAQMSRLGELGSLRGRISHDLGPVHMPVWIVFVRTLLPIHFLSYFARAFECYHLARRQNQIGAAGRVAAAALTFFIYTKFAEAADQHIFAAFQGVFDDLDQVLDGLYVIVLGKAVFPGDQFCNLSLG